MIVFILRSWLLHYFALLMYFLTSHVHNSVSCEILFCGSKEGKFSVDKVQNQSFRCLRRFFVVIFRQVFLFCFCSFVSVGFFGLFWAAKTQIICQNTRVHSKVRACLPLTSSKVVSICIRNFLAPATCPTLVFECGYSRRSWTETSLCGESPVKVEAASGIFKYKIFILCWSSGVGCESI